MRPWSRLHRAPRPEFELRLYMRSGDVVVVSRLAEVHVESRGGRFCGVRLEYLDTVGVERPLLPTLDVGAVECATVRRTR